MNRWLSVGVWIASLMVALGLGMHTLLARRTRSEESEFALALAVVPFVLNLFVLVLFVWVFLIQRTSNVAQIAGSSGMEAWSFWASSWPLCAIMTLLVAAPLSLFCAALPPYPPKAADSWLTRLTLLGVTGLTWYHLVKSMPTA